MLPGSGVCSLNRSGTAAIRRAKPSSITFALAASIRGANRAPVHRLLQQDLGHLGLTVAQENKRSSWLAGKGIDAPGGDLEFRPSGLLRQKPFTVTGDGEHAAQGPVRTSRHMNRSAPASASTASPGNSATRIARMSRPFWLSISSAGCRSSPTAKVIWPAAAG